VGIAHPNLASGSSDVPCSKSPQTHIAELADDYLRTLIGLLCEAELARRGLPVSVVTWGGNQRAADGGLDVRVSLPAGSAVADFMPRPNTGFQVKCQDMPRAAILEEMRPSGVLRPVIRELADASGAYVIASSQGSTADSALRNRCAAMAEAVAGLPNAEALTLDFHDRTRLASWVRPTPADHFTEAERRGRLLSVPFSKPLISLACARRAGRRPFARNGSARATHATCYVVRGRGLVVISSCSHCGLINAIRHGTPKSATAFSRAMLEKRPSLLSLRASARRWRGPSRL